MTKRQTSELISACCRLLSVSPEVAQSIIGDLYEDAEIAHFHLATLVNLLKSAERDPLNEWERESLGKALSPGPAIAAALVQPVRH